MKTNEEVTERIKRTGKYSVDFKPKHDKLVARLDEIMRSMDALHYV